MLRILYGQSDAGRGFWIHLEEVLLKFGLERSDADPCTFSKGSTDNGDLFVVCTHVDDGPIFAQRKEDIDSLEQHLKDNFDVVKLSRDPEVMVGMQLEQREDGLFIHQRQYANQIKERFPDVGTREEVTPATTEKDTETEVMLDQKLTHDFRANGNTLTHPGRRGGECCRLQRQIHPLIIQINPLIIQITFLNRLSRLDLPPSHGITSRRFKTCSRAF